MLKNKLYLVIAAVVVVILAVGGGWYVLSQKKAAPVAQDDNIQVLTLSPEDVGLTVSLRPDNKAMKFTIAKPQGITNIDYSIAYTADQKGEQVSQGLIGTLTPTGGETSLSTSYREFGTCSSGVCRYDTVVSPVTLTLKITKSDNKVYQVQTTINLPASN